MELRVGDRVKVTPKDTSVPYNWIGKDLTGTVLIVEDDTAGLEIDNGKGQGHNFVQDGTLTSTENGWWFSLVELEPLV